MSMGSEMILMEIFLILNSGIYQASTVIISIPKIVVQ